MAYDKGLAQRISEQLQSRDDVKEKKMFGGICFMVAGHMCCGVVENKLMARVGPDQYQDSLSMPHAKEMDFTGKAMKGFLYVESAGLKSDENLCGWIERCLAFVHSLPPR